MRVRTSLTMIFNNEQATLGRCMSSVCAIVIEIIGMDTGYGVWRLDHLIPTTSVR
jgi:hypothetical protein